MFASKSKYTHFILLLQDKNCINSVLRPCYCAILPFKKLFLPPFWLTWPTCFTKGDNLIVAGRGSRVFFAGIFRGSRGFFRGSRVFVAGFFAGFSSGRITARCINVPISSRGE